MKFRLYPQAALCASVLLANLTLVSETQAQTGPESDAPIEEILVTARKIEESIQDIPLSITAFSERDIKERSIEELEDIALFTPGLTFEDYSNGGFGSPIIRGASQFSIDALEQNVSTFVDGVYIPRQYAVDLGMVNMQRVEVVKGPQSALYGANAFMGAINYVTRKADLNEMYADFGIEIGDGGRQDISGELSYPIIAEKLAIKLNYKTSEYDGDWDNDHPGESIYSGQGTDGDLSGWDNDSFGIGIVAQPIEALKIEVSYNNYETEIESRAQTRLTMTSFDLNCGARAFGVFSRVYCGELPDTPVAPGGAGVETGFLVDPRSYSETETEMLRAAVSYDINENLSVSYQYSQIETEIFAPGNADRNPIAGTVPFGGTEPANFFTILPVGDFDFDSHELRLEYAADNGFYAMFGFYRSEVEDLDDGIAGYAGSLWTDTANFTEINLSDIPAATRNNRVTTNETEALFARVAIPFLDEQLILAIEGRYTDEEKTGSDSTGQFNFDDSYFTPRVSLDYHLDDNNLVYVSYAEGTKSGGINPAVVRNAFFQFVPLDASERFYGADENETIEIGVRSTFLDRRLQVNATLFYVDWSNLQVSVAAQGATPTTQVITANLGSATSKGLELDLNYAISQNWKVNAGLAVIDATYDSGTSSQRVVRAGLCDDVVCSSTGDIGGNDLPRSSDLQWNVGIQYDGTFGEGLGYYVRADYAGQSDQYVEEINTAKIQDRALLNLRAGLSGENWDVELWVKNATDEEYVSNAFYIPSPFFVDYVPTYGNLRRMGLSLNYSF